MDDGSGSLSMDEIQQATKDRLPDGTSYPDLTAQLTARLAVDAIDSDERDKPVAERTLSQAEWLQAIEELAGGG
jgi:hypothetical protein